MELPARRGAVPPDEPGRSADFAALLYWQGDAERPAALYEEALAVDRGLGDQSQIGETLYALAWANVARQAYGPAMERAGEALAQYGRAGDRAGAAIVTAWLQTGAVSHGHGWECRRGPGRVPRRRGREPRARAEL